ncbi:UNVERIFIED_ORG: HEPN domain-containing protein [Bacillus cereus]
MKPFPTAIICYHSQQCVEKLLKGFLALNGRPVPKTHNLLMLHKSCCKLDDKFSLILEQCVQLNGYATDIRYRNVMNRRSLQTLLRNENKGDADLFSLQNHTEYDYIMFDRTEKGDYVPGGLTIEGRRMLLEYLFFTQQEMNTSLISEEEIEAVLQTWYETDGIRVYRDELEPIHHAYLGELVFKPDCTINEEKTTSPFPVFFVGIDVHLGKQ